MTIIVLHSYILRNNITVGTYGNTNTVNRIHHWRDGQKLEQ